MSTASAVEPLRAANLLIEQQLYDLSFMSARGGWMSVPSRVCSKQSLFQKQPVDSIFCSLWLPAIR
ncbi:hypothetical protein BFX40_10290 [Mesorhizobium sp. SEMIA 3007]|nr:hypothetical protein BFX40_10290 [Mesorhizobium sp. SEMIA 3007]